MGKVLRQRKEHVESTRQVVLVSEMALEVPPARLSFDLSLPVYCGFKPILILRWKKRSVQEACKSEARTSETLRRVA